MIEQDTVRLLRECDAGIEMGVASIDDVLDTARDKNLIAALESCKNQHCALQSEIDALLTRYHDDGKQPAAVAKGMSKMKTGVKLALEKSDRMVADLITDGCNMGVKSLSKYLNQYKAADEKSKDIAKRLIAQELQLSQDMRQFL